MRAILAEFAPVPNAPSELVSASVAADIPVQTHAADSVQAPEAVTPVEFGGPQGPEPTRYGDWEKNGRCVDF
jgi:hypothetical protein